MESEVGGFIVAENDCICCRDVVGECFFGKQDAFLLQETLDSLSEVIGMPLIEQT